MHLHIEAWNKLIVKQKFCTLSWLITDVNGLIIFTAYISVWLHFAQSSFFFRPQLAYYFVSFWQRPIPYFQDSCSSPSIILFRGGDKYMQNFGG